MTHTVSRELGLALDFTLENYSPEYILNDHIGSWIEECQPLNGITTYELAKYLFEGYQYPKSKEESFEIFVDWLNDYNNHTPYPTRNSSYRRGRRNTLEEIKNKLTELGLIEKSSDH